ALGLRAPCHNSYMITVAQVVECVHCLEDAIELIDTVLRRGVRREPIAVTPRAGRGIGATEVPRGVLYHDYTFNAQGLIEKANCVIPTGQNLANIELDMRTLVPQVLDKSPEAITQLSEMLVRAYDPCISCSAHFLNVEFVE
ncbi:MAG TPA: nickel-dependent hydrogenase large subunit, partial [Acidobacteriota bacterium]|nr:nickel-dependent hydrogenase large subunit [Acidobacteriota bacterium]